MTSFFNDTQWSSLVLPNVGDSGVAFPGRGSVGLAFLQRVGYVRILLTLVILRLSWIIVYAFFFSPLRDIPGPLMARLSSKRGLVHLLTGKAEAVAKADYQTYGDIYMARPDTVFICDPRDICNVLNSRHFRKTDMYRIFEYEGIPNVSTFTDPAEAARRRRQLHPFFNQSYLSRMESIMLDHGITALKARWDKILAESETGRSAMINYRHDTVLAMFDITGALVFGREFHALETNNLVYAKWVNNALSYMLTNHYFPLLKRFPFSFLSRNLKKSYNDLVQFSLESINIRKQKLKEGLEKPADLLQALLDAEDPDSKVRMTESEVQAESIAMLVGGSESTSSVISWVVHFLLSHPEHFRRVVDEVRSRFPADKVLTHSQARAELPYLEACVYETLRCIPTASTSFPRVCDTMGITIKGFYIPPGTEIATNKCAAHLHKESWEDPFTFNPARFLNNNFDARRNMLAFAYGTRFCIGRNLAWVVMMGTLSNLFKDYDIALPEDSVYGPHNVDEHGRPRIMPTKLGVATMPANPERDCRMILSKRADA